MDIPVIDLTPYVNVVSGEFCLDDIMNPEVETVCMEVSWILRDTGALFVKDPRCSAEDDDQFISMMEKYFEMPDDFKLLQARPHQHYQVTFIYRFLFCPNFSDVYEFFLVYA